MTHMFQWLQFRSGQLGPSLFVLRLIYDTWLGPGEAKALADAPSAFF